MSAALVRQRIVCNNSDGKTNSVAGENKIFDRSVRLFIKTKLFNLTLQRGWLETQQSRRPVFAVNAAATPLQSLYNYLPHLSFEI